MFFYTSGELIDLNDLHDILASKHTMCSVYPQLVRTLEELFRSGVEEFLMSWNRRIAESGQFFELMQAAGAVRRC